MHDQVLIHARIPVVWLTGHQNFSKNFGFISIRSVSVLLLCVLAIAIAVSSNSTLQGYSAWSEVFQYVTNSSCPDRLSCKALSLSPKLMGPSGNSSTFVVSLYFSIPLTTWARKLRRHPRRHHTPSVCLRNSGGPTGTVFSFAAYLDFLHFIASMHHDMLIFLTKVSNVWSSRSEALQEYIRN